MYKSEKLFIIFGLLTVICLNIRFSTIGFFNALMDAYAFRQTQTAISAYFFLKEGFTLNYITPVLGAPWSIPLEFPTYQFVVAALSYLTRLPLESAGRLVSMMFFYVALVYIYKILLLFFDKYLSLIPIIFLLVCPQYIYWSRTFMIESTALFFCIAHLYYLLKLNKVINTRLLFLCLLFGVVGSLTKITTYLVVMTPAGIYLLYRLFSDIWSREINTKFWITLIFPVFTSFVVAIFWNNYCDHLKNLNPLAQGFITSNSLTKWNFGTFQQRLNLNNWKGIASWTIQYGVGSPYVLMLLPLWGVLISKRNRLFIGLSLAGFLSGPLVFFNLYYVHSYYHYSNLFFIVIAIGVVIIAVAGDHDLPHLLRRSAIWVAMPIVTIVMFYSYYSSDYLKFQSNKLEISPQTSCLQNHLQETAVLLIYDNDWSPELPYHLKRKAIMNRANLPLDHPRMVSSVNMTGRDKIVAIIKKDFNIVFEEEVWKVFGKRFLPVSPEIFIREDHYSEISRVCKYTSDGK
jgi:hypothetical protein